MPHQQFLSIKEIVEIINNSDSDDEQAREIGNAEEIDIVALPPSTVDETSENEGVDDEVQEIQPSNVTTLPLDIAGEIEVQWCAAISSTPSQSETKTTTMDRPIFVTQKPKWNNMTCRKEFVFDKGPVDVSAAKQQELFELLGDCNPYQLLKLFIDDEIIEFLVDSTMKYAGVNCNDPTFRTDYDEICQFIGILFVSGYSPKPSIRSYWSDSPTLGVPCIKEVMTRVRFKRIKKYFHVCDNQNLDANDKFAKVTPLNNMMNSRFMQFGIFSHHLSIDEQMIAYFGRHSCKMFIKGKPIRFGFKYWDLCSSGAKLCN